MASEHTTAATTLNTIAASDTNVALDIPFGEEKFKSTAPLNCKQAAYISTLDIRPQREDESVLQRVHLSHTICEELHPVTEARQMYFVSDKVSSLLTFQF
jgi:hypothetical protein